MAFDGPALAPSLRAFLAAGLILDPWLAGLADERFSFDSQDLLARVADGMAGEHWKEPVVAETLARLPALRSLGRRAVLEILTSSAATIAHDRVGRIAVDLETAEEAVRRLTRFAGERGFGDLVRVYLAVSLAESQGALAHYGRLSEDDFISGVRHRPWAHGPMDGDLVVGIARRSYRLVVEGGRRSVEATPTGRRQLLRVQKALRESGYLAERLRLTWVSHFNLDEDADRFVTHVLPGADGERRAFTRFAGIEPGMAVLDVGCGTGAQMFEGGLWDAVGPGGSLCGLDPAVGMLERARRKAEARGAANVRFVQGRAESLPFPAGAFGAAIAVSVLEYTDAPRAVAEMVRVVRPGGAVVLVGAGPSEAGAPPALREWLAPALQAAERYGVDPRGRARDHEGMGALLRAAGCTAVRTERGEAAVILSDAEFTVRNMTQGGGFVQEVLERLPWAARQDLIGELVERGRAILARTPAPERTVAVHTHRARGVVAPAAGRAAPNPTGADVTSVE